MMGSLTRKWYSRLVKSADNSPVTKRRPLCIPGRGLESVCTPRVFVQEASSMSSDDTNYNGTTTSLSLPPTPASARKNTLSKRLKIWTSLKRHSLLRPKPRSRVNSTDIGSLSPRDREESRHSLSKSHPNLLEGRIDKKDKSGKAPSSPKIGRTLGPKLRSIIRGGNPKVDKQKVEEKIPATHHVEFAKQDKQQLDDVLPLAKKMLQRQSTKESQSSSNIDTFESVLGTDRQMSASETGPYVTFQLNVNLKDGKDLVIRDASGSSDPYVKFKYQDKIVYKSNTIFKNLNPIWNEKFAVLIDDPTSPLAMEVFDYDRFAMDDFMGSSKLDLSQLRLFESVELKIELGEEGNDEYMGYLIIEVTITPLTQEDKDTFLKKSNTRMNADARKSGPKTATPTYIVNVVLVEAKNLLPVESGALPDPFIKFKLGTEKHKSKVATRTLEPKWPEQFDMHVYDTQMHTLEMMVFDKKKDLFMGRCCIDLQDISREESVQNWYDLEDGAGSILLVLSISGIIGSETVSDLNVYCPDPGKTTLLKDRFTIPYTFQNLREVGYLTVKVFKAQGLAAADIGGKSDPFCVLELVNSRLQTQTEYKTLNPEWNKIFTFTIKDIHSNLEITVYDEDQNKKVEFLGKVAIPLLKIKNGEKRWYVMKDKKLQSRSKGQILLEMEVIWNIVRASMRTFNPREEKFMWQEPKFKRQVLMRNVARVKRFGLGFADMGAFLKSCWSWESPLRSMVAFVSFEVIVYCFELYMLPMVLLMLFVKAAFQRWLIEGLRIREEDEEYFDSDEEEDDIDSKTADTKEERKSLKERLQSVTDTLAMIQNSLETVASHLERVKNVLNFTCPFLSWLAVVVLLVATILLYFVPLRFLIMAWGLNKFTKKLRKPHAIDNNELLDFLSRVPSDGDARECGEFRPDPIDSIIARDVVRKMKPTK